TIRARVSLIFSSHPSRLAFSRANDGGQPPRRVSRASVGCTAKLGGSHTTFLVTWITGTARRSERIRIPSAAFWGEEKVPYGPPFGSRGRAVLEVPNDRRRSEAPIALHESCDDHAGEDCCHPSTSDAEEQRPPPCRQVAISAVTGKPEE